MSDADSSSESPPSTSGNRFPSLTALRAAHNQLLKRHSQQGVTPELESELRAFIRRGRATGALLDDDEDRWASQGLLDYWSTMLDRAGLTAPDDTLDEFDPTLAPELPDSLCPYQGLDAFGEDAHEVFFGRQRLIGQMVAQLETGRLLAVVGSSGCGKSSLVLAGLMPALKAGALPGSDAWFYAPQLVPGANPLAKLAAALQPPGADAAEWIPEQVERFRQSGDHLARLAAELASGPLVLVIDQFEEVFTLCDDEEARQAFADNLVGLARTPHAEHRLILTVRIDFEDYVTRLPGLHSLYADAVVRVTPLTAGELREAIEGPAELVGLKFQEGVVSALLHDILGEPAALPLLQFTLLKLWDKRERNRVTWETYQSLGGARQALAQSADEFYESLIPEDQVAVRRILLRMLRPTEGLEVTSNRIRRGVLYRAGEARDRVDRVLKRLVKARLVHLTLGDTQDEDQVEVAHEALVRNWPRLVGWLEDERERMRRRLRLTAAAQHWQAVGRDPGGLLRGVLLDEALSYGDLDELEAEFVRASQAEIERQYEEEISHQRELARAQALAEAERERAEVQARGRMRLRWLVAALVVVAALAVAAALFAGVQQQRAQEEATRRAREVVVRRAAEAEAEAERDRAEGQLRKTTGLRLAAEAANELGIDPERGILLALEAVLATYDEDGSVTIEAAAALQRAVQTLPMERSLLVDSDWIAAVAFSPDGTRLAAAVGSDPRVWAVDSGQELFTLSQYHGLASDIVFSPDGSLIATANANDAAVLWDAASGRELQTLTGHKDWVYAVAFSPDGRRLASASWDQTARVWDVWSGQELYALSGHKDWVYAVAFSPDGELLATGSKDGTVVVWDLASRSPLYSLPSNSGGVLSVAFSPDGRYLISGGWDGLVHIWEIAAGGGSAIGESGAVTGMTPGVEKPLFTLRGHTGSVYDLAFGADGAWLASASEDRSTKIWDWEASLATESGVELYTLFGHSDVVNGVDLGAGGRYLATGSDDGSVRIWNLSSRGEMARLPGQRSVVEGLAFSRDGSRLATGSAGGTVKVWDAESGRELRSLPGHPGVVWSIAFSPDGKRLAAASEDTLKLWDLASGSSLLSFTAGSKGINQVAFSPDGRYLIIAGNDALAKIWDLEALALDPMTAPLLTLEGHASWVGVAGYSEDGARVLTLSRDNTGKVWDAQSGRELDTLSCRIGDQDPFSLSPDWAYFAVGSADGTVRVCEVASGLDVLTFAAADGGLDSVGYGPDGRRLVTVAGEILTLWELPSPLAAGAPVSLLSLPGQPGGVRRFLFNDDGTRLMTSSVTGRVKVWDVEASVTTGAGVEQYTLPDYRDGEVREDVMSPDGSHLAKGTWRLVEVWDLTDASSGAVEDRALSLCCHAGWINAIAFSEDGTRVATGGEDGTAKVWDAQSGELLLNLEGHYGNVWSVAFSPDGKLLATGGFYEAARVWDLGSGEEVRRFEGDEESTSVLAFGPDGRLLAKGDFDGLVRVWDLATETEVVSFQAHTENIWDLVISPDGRFMATTSYDRKVKVWDLSAADPEETQRLLLGHTDRVQAFAFSPDSTLLATSSRDRTVRVWDLASWKAVFTLTGHSAWVRDLAFTPDGMHIVSYSGSGRVLVHTLDIEELKTLACERTSRNLSQDEWKAYIGTDLPYRETCPGLPVPP